MAEPHDNTSPSGYKLCTIDGCDRPLFAKGLCNCHYERLRKYGRTAPLRRLSKRRPYVCRKHCVIEGCGRPYYGREMCTLHYARWLRHGDPLYQSKRAFGSGTITPGGYIVRYIGGVRVLEHRLIASQALGRPLQPDEHVHHRDHNPLNNTPENLVVLSPSAHSKLHGPRRKLRDSWTIECSGCKRLQPRSAFPPAKDTYCHECDNRRHWWRHQFK